MFTIIAVLVCAPLCLGLTPPSVGDPLLTPSVEYHLSTIDREIADSFANSNDVTDLEKIHEFLLDGGMKSKSAIHELLKHYGMKTNLNPFDYKMIIETYKMIFETFWNISGAYAVMIENLLSSGSNKEIHFGAILLALWPYRGPAPKKLHQMLLKNQFTTGDNLYEYYLYCGLSWQNLEYEEQVSEVPLPLSKDDVTHHLATLDNEILKFSRDPNSTASPNEAHLIDFSILVLIHNYYKVYGGLYQERIWALKAKTTSALITASSCLISGHGNRFARHGFVTPSSGLITPNGRRVRQPIYQIDVFGGMIKNLLNGRNNEIHLGAILLTLWPYDCSYRQWNLHDMLLRHPFMTDDSVEAYVFYCGMSWWNMKSKKENVCVPPLELSYQIRDNLATVEKEIGLEVQDGRICKQRSSYSILALLLHYKYVTADDMRCLMSASYRGSSYAFLQEVKSMYSCNDYKDLIYKLFRGDEYAKRFGAILICLWPYSVASESLPEELLRKFWESKRFIVVEGDLLLKLSDDKIMHHLDTLDKEIELERHSSSSYSILVLLLHYRYHLGKKMTEYDMRRLTSASKRGSSHIVIQEFKSMYSGDVYYDMINKLFGGDAHEKRFGAILICLMRYSVARNGVALFRKLLEYGGSNVVKGGLYIGYISQKEDILEQFYEIEKDVLMRSYEMLPFNRENTDPSNIRKIWDALLLWAPRKKAIELCKTATASLKPLVWTAIFEVVLIRECGTNNKRRIMDVVNDLVSEKPLVEKKNEYVLEALIRIWIVFQSGSRISYGNVIHPTVQEVEKRDLDAVNYLVRKDLEEFRSKVVRSAGSTNPLPTVLKEFDDLYKDGTLSPARIVPHYPDRLAEQFRLLTTSEKETLDIEQCFTVGDFIVAYVKCGYLKEHWASLCKSNPGWRLVAWILNPPSTSSAKGKGNWF